MPDDSSIICLKDTHTIEKISGDSYACKECGVCFRIEQRDSRLYPTTENLTGRIFDRLTVIDFGGYKIRGGKPKAHWQCRCTEGNILIVEASNLKHGRTRSCGCFKIEETIKRSTIHGKRHTPEFTIWVDMRRRCNSQTNLAYHNYGGRGITVCDTWDSSFAAFYEDMGPRPTPKHTLDRIDNMQGYNPENCQWATRYTQSRNKRSTIMLTLNDITQCAEDWAVQLGIKPATLRKRIRDGWSHQDALTIPTGISNNHNRKCK